MSPDPADLQDDYDDFREIIARSETEMIKDLLNNAMQGYIGEFNTESTLEALKLTIERALAGNAYKLIGITRVHDEIIVQLAPTVEYTNLKFDYPMIWTPNRPTAPGFYWYQDTLSTGPMVVQVIRQAYEDLYAVQLNTVLNTSLPAVDEHWGDRPIAEPTEPWRT